MLSELRIENLLLIARAEVEFDAGYNAFTGETGAGKSLLLDAIEFLLGARGDAEMIRHGAAQAEVTARFMLHDRELAAAFTRDLGIAFEEDVQPHGSDGSHELVLSRVIPRAGRARAHANGRPIALPALRKLGERLLDIHGQNENQSLLRVQTRLEILDRFSGAENERETVRRNHGAALDRARALAELRRTARDRHGRQELKRFQLDELNAAQLDEHEPAELESRVKLLRGAEKFRDAGLSASTLLDGEENDGAAQFMARALKALASVGDAGPEAAALHGRIDELLTNARDAAHDAAALAEKATGNPEQLAELEEAFSRIRTLQRKHGRNHAELKALRDKLNAELSGLDQLDTRTEASENELARAISTLKDACAELSRKRKAGARQLEKKVNAELRGMGLNHASLQIELTPHKSEAQQAGESHAEIDGLSEADEPGDLEASAMLPAQYKSSGSEGADILFSANPELPPKPLRECASGGEIARVMLALKGVLARTGGADRLPVVVFDEVDSGIGGRLGAMIGKKLRDLAAVRQVISVTHQPQLAAFAQRQFKVSKSQSAKATLVTVEQLDGENRIKEIALMLRGTDASAHTREEAAAMLKAAQA